MEGRAINESTLINTLYDEAKQQSSLQRTPNTTIMVNQVYAVSLLWHFCPCNHMLTACFVCFCLESAHLHVGCTPTVLHFTHPTYLFLVWLQRCPRTSGEPHNTNISHRTLIVHAICIWVRRCTPNRCLWRQTTETTTSCPSRPCTEKWSTSMRTAGPQPDAVHRPPRTSSMMLRELPVEFAVWRQHRCGCGRRSSFWHFREDAPHLFLFVACPPPKQASR